MTEDGSGLYHHTAVLRDGRLIGTTHSIGRDFLARWTAVGALECSKVVAVGDLHGGIDALVSVLDETELIGDDPDTEHPTDAFPAVREIVLY